MSTLKEKIINIAACLQIIFWTLVYITITFIGIVWYANPLVMASIIALWILYFIVMHQFLKENIKPNPYWLDYAEKEE